MPVITLQIAFAQPVRKFVVGVTTKRKFIASPSIFTVSDIFFSKPEWGYKVDIGQTLPGAAALIDAYDSARRGDDNMENGRITSDMERKHPFVQLDKHDWMQLMQYHFPDLKIEKVQSEHHSSEMLMDEMHWPSIKIKSLDQTEETLYFFSVSEAEEALRLILEGINNG